MRSWGTRSCRRRRARSRDPAPGPGPTSRDTPTRPCGPRPNAGAATAPLPHHARVPRTHQLDASVVHHTWDNAIAPRLAIDDGDTVVVRCRDSADGYYRRGMTSADVGKREFKGHPLTGPI